MTARRGATPPLTEGALDETEVSDIAGRGFSPAQVDSLRWQTETPIMLVMSIIRSGAVRPLMLSV